MSPVKQKVVEDEIDKMLELGVTPTLTPITLKSVYRR